MKKKLKEKENCDFENGRFKKIAYSRGAQIQGARSRGGLNFVRWRRILVGPQYGTCFVSPFWWLEFSGDSGIFFLKICVHVEYAVLFIVGTKFSKLALTHLVILIAVAI